MPNSPPALDDRGFEDLVEEMLARIPAHTPEWVPQEGDPGRTLIELFAWLADTILYRANLVPERQRLAFLRLLGQQMRPAAAATGIVTVSAKPTGTAVIDVARGALLDGPAAFETTAPLTVLPVSGECYYKRPLDAGEAADLAEVLEGLRDFHELTDSVSGYVSEPVFDGVAADGAGLDVVTDTADHALWIALLADAPDNVTAVRRSLSGEDVPVARAIGVGVAPAVAVPDALEGVDVGGRISHRWHISTATLRDDEPVYLPLDYVGPGLTLNNRAAAALGIPSRASTFGVLEGDVRVDANAGVGQRPPRLDDPDKLARIVAWLRLTPDASVASLPLSWAGVNAVEVDQRRTINAVVVGQGDGSANQTLDLPWTAIDPDSLQLEIEETDRGYVRWTRTDDLALHGRDDPVFVLNSAEATLTFGNGLNGRVPEPGRRIRVVEARAGGGAAGNLPSGSLTTLSGFDLSGSPLTQPMTANQPVPTRGGFDAETLAEAERRIPAWLRHRNRGVTADDYATLAADAPGVALGRVELLPRFVPQQRREGVPGVVSVMVLPQQSRREAPNPRPDRPTIEKVFNHLDARRPLATELYVIGAEYVPLSVSLAISIRNGFVRDEVIAAVKQALADYLWTLVPHGPQGAGWPLGRPVLDRELEVVAGRVPGVLTVPGVNLFRSSGDAWLMIPRSTPGAGVQLDIEGWQLPELMGVVVTTDAAPPDSLTLPPGTPAGGIAVPVIPEVC